MMKGEKGFSLAEVMVAMTILGVFSVSILSGISTAYHAAFLADVQSSAESLARAEMEYLKTCTYDYYEESIPPSYEKDEATSPDYLGYRISVDAIPIDRDTGEAFLNPNDDEGIQMLIVTINHVDRPGIDIVTLEAYKVDR
jgi:prepilin-type N-terminal cleavage/methylation domain-containing protein